MEEIWKPVVGYEWSYIVSNKWNVASLKNGNMKILKSCLNKWWYLHLSLCKEWNQKNFKIHRLVAIAFLKNPENKPQVNHIDWNKRNNHLSNLEFCTNSYNQKHAYSIWLNKTTEKHHFKANHPSKWRFWWDHHGSKPVNQINKFSWEVIKTWSSSVEVERELWISQWSISKCCNWKSWAKIAGGFIWKFTN